MNTVKSTIFQIIKRKESLIFLILFIAGLSLFGWLFDLMSLSSFSPKYIPIPPSSVVMFITLSIAGQSVFQFHCHVIPRYIGDMKNPRGGVRHCIEGKGYY